MGVRRSAVPVFAVLATVSGTLGGCTYQRADERASEAPGTAAAQSVTIEPAPEHLRGRVALPAGARLYSRPNYASPSWSLTLPDPPLSSADGPPRVRAFRVIGVVRGQPGELGAAGDFVAITNDLAGEDADAPIGCGPPVYDLEHLRAVLFVPVVHLAEVTTRVLELEPFSPGTGPERLRIGAGVRVGAELSLAGLPTPPSGSRWRWIDADGIRTLVAIPDEAVGVAWDPGRVPELGDAGDPLMRDAEGSMMWLRDGGGSTVELTLRNACGELVREVSEPAEVEGLRALVLEVFYDQSPRPEVPDAIPADADYRISAGTPLRWTDGELAGEVRADWPVTLGVGQTWDGRRCFPLALGAELAAVDSPALACVDPEALELLAANASFGVSDELALGGSVELGPVEVVAGGPWDERALLALLNGRHESVGECLRPLLLASEALEAARWDLRMTVTELGRVDEVELVVRGPSHDAVEDCLRAEAFTWLLPEGSAGQLLVPVTLGPWTPALDPNQVSGEPGDVASEEPGGEAEPRPDPGRGKVIIIRDEEPEQPEEPEPEEP